MLRTVRLLVAIAALISFCSAEKPSDLQHHGAANDFAQVLTAEQKQQIEELSEQVWTNHHAKISVVTIKSLNGSTVEDFASDLFKRWGIGGKDDRGVLILLAVNDRKYRVEVGYGLEPILPDGKVGGFGREAVPYLRKQDYGNAIALMATRVAETIAADAGVTDAAAGQNTEMVTASSETPAEYVDERSFTQRTRDWLIDSPVHIFALVMAGLVLSIPVRFVYQLRKERFFDKIKVNVPEGKDPAKQVPIWLLVVPVAGFFGMNFVLSLLELRKPLLWFALFIGLVATWVLTLRRLMKNGWWLPKSGTAGGSPWDSDSSSSSSSWSSSSSSSDSGYDGGSSGGGGASGSW